MAESIFSSLLSTLDSRSIGAVAGALGESENSVLTGLRTSISAVLAAIASRAEDSTIIRRIYDMCRGETGEINWPQLAGSVADPNSPIISAGKRMLGTLFGSSEGSVASAVSAESGLRPSSNSWIMAMAAPMVMSFLGRRIREEGMTPASLATMFQREAPAIRAALPESLSNLFWPRVSTAGTTAAPHVITPTTAPRSHSRWPAALALVAIALGLVWLLNHARTPRTARVTPTPSTAPSGTASRMATETETGQTPPQNIDLRFNTGSSTLAADSRNQLDQMVMVVTKNPGTRLKVSGYTDDRGDPNRNLALSQRRADAVVAVLVKKGVPRDNITAEGYGQESPIADNSTPEGRAENRRVNVGVMNK